MIKDRRLLIDEIAAHFAKGEGFQNIVAARKFASGILQQPIESGTIIAKIVEEAIEAGIVRAARSIVKNSITTTEAFDRLVELYDRQPNLRSRSSTSIKEQAYSTPLPVAYLAAVLADIQPDLTVYEPSAGHGALLLEANPSQSIVNELNPDRAAELRLQGYEVNIGDATLYSPSQPVDRVIMNPPFGTVTDRNGSKQKWQVTGGKATKQYTTARIDHAIVLRGLAALKDDGKAALIIGAPLSNRTNTSGDAEASASTYNGKDMRAFYYSLYQNYNVINHFSIAGNIYGKQGTNFPIDIVVVDGRGKASRRLPAVDVPQVYTTFEQLKELLPNEIRQVSRSAIMWIPPGDETIQNLGVILTNSNQPLKDTDQYLTVLAERIEILILEASLIRKPEDLERYLDLELYNLEELEEQKKLDLSIESVIREEIYPILNQSKFINQVGMTQNPSAWEWSQILTLHNNLFRETLVQAMQDRCYYENLVLFPIEPIPATAQGREAAEMNLGEWLEMMADTSN
jgi:hypothetical protein